MKKILVLALSLMYGSLSFCQLSRPAMITEINSKVYQNTTHQVTGTILNGVKQDMANSYWNKITDGTPITGSGTLHHYPIWTGSTTLGNANLYDSLTYTLIPNGNLLAGANGLYSIDLNLGHLLSPNGTNHFGWDNTGLKVNLGSDLTGDIYYRNSSGYLTRLPASTSGRLLQTNGTGTAPTWVAPPTASPLTTKGDIYVYSSTNARLPVGSDGQALVAASGATTGLSWATIVGTTGATGATGATGPNSIAYNTTGISGPTGSIPYSDGSKAQGLSMGSAGTFLMCNGTNTAPIVSTLVLPNSGTTGRIPYFISTNTIGSDATLKTDGTGGVTLTGTGTGSAALAYLACRDVTGALTGYFGDASASDADLYFYATNNLQFWSGGAETMYLKSTGALGIGQLSPTAILHLKAGTATASTAPLKFTDGTLLTTAEAGAVEAVTDRLTYTTATGTTRKDFSLLVYRGITADRTADGSDELINLTNGTHTVTLPTAVGFKGLYTVKNSNTGLLTIATTSSQTIDGNASGTIILNQYDSYTFRSNGSNWIITK